jgi:predicted metal-binding transcription factor (methanogenesis marker protein 9)
MGKKEKKQLTEDELQRFSAARMNYYELKEHLADVVVAEERLKTDKQTTLMNIGIAHDDLLKVQKEIHDKYGEGKVNMQTGEIVS